jgi:very-short-patch-repair endonuclease
MASPNRGQLGAASSHPEFLGRDTSGIRIGRNQRSSLDQLRSLEKLVHTTDGKCWVSGPTAAALHGFDGYTLRPPFHLVVTRGRSLYRVGHVTHRLRDLDRLDCSVVHDIPVLSPTRTLIELAATEPTERLTIAVDSALRDLGTTEDFLHRRIVELRRKGRAGPAALLAVLAGQEALRGGHSWLERAFLALCAESGLPRPLTQQVVGTRGQRLIRVDCRFPDSDVVVELLGYSFHRSPMQLQADTERTNVMLLAGLRPLQFTYHDIVARPGDTIGTVLEALSGFARNRTSASGRTQKSG